MVFGWQGFSLEHPDDWAPNALSGTRAEGYARISSVENAFCQIRWKQLRAEPDLEDRLTQYLAKLRRDTQKAKAKFSSEIHAEAERIVYSYRGLTQGKGCVAYDRTSQRVFFVEVAGKKGDPVSNRFGQIWQSLHFGDPERWALFGLNVVVPSGWKVTRQDLKSGRTTLELERPGAALTLDRWGFAHQLMAKHDLEAWAQSVLRLTSAEMTESPCGIELRSNSRLFQAPLVAFVCPQPDRNQIVIASSRTRREAWRPQWNWFE